MKALEMADPRGACVGGLEPGRYADGRPPDDVRFADGKPILETEGFTKPRGFGKHARLATRAPGERGAGFDASSVEGSRPPIREVVSRAPLNKRHLRESPGDPDRGYDS